MDLRLGFIELHNLPPRIREVSAQVVRVSPLRPGNDSTVAVRFGNADLANLIFGELLRAKVRTSSALFGIIQALSPGRETGRVIEDMCRTTERAMEAERVLLFLREPRRKVLRARTGVADRPQEFQIRLGEGAVAKAAERGQLINVGYLSMGSRHRLEVEKFLGEGARSLLGVPLSREDGISPGMLVILNKRYGRFTREDEGLGIAVARQISIVLREARLFEEIRNLKNYYERILESVATGILTFEGLGKLATINRAGAEIFGFRANHDAGKNFARLFRGTANARLASLAEDVLTQRRARTIYDVRFLRRDGVSLSLDLRALPLEDARGNSLGCVLVAEDITQEQRLMSTLCRYMAREVAEQVLQDKDKLKLGGRRMEVTILLTDIRNFTTISEQLDPWDIEIGRASCRERV